MEEELKEKLEKLLLTLKRNKENVPIEQLKTRYKKSYDKLCKEISYVAEEYAKEVTLAGMQISDKYWKEAEPIIYNTIQTSQTLKKLSTAAFKHQDIKEFEKIAQTLRKLILKNLEEHFMNKIKKENGLIF